MAGSGAINNPPVRNNIPYRGNFYSAGSGGRTIKKLTDL